MPSQFGQSATRRKDEPNAQKTTANKIKKVVKWEEALSKAHEGLESWEHERALGRCSAWRRGAPRPRARAAG